MSSEAPDGPVGLVAPAKSNPDSKGSVLVVDDEVELLVSCRKILSRLGYPWADETRNPAYRLFLK